MFYLLFFFFFFFNDTATTEIYTLSLHDALPISPPGAIVGGLLYLLYVYREFSFAAGPSGVAMWIDEWLDSLQGQTLVAAGKWLAGGAVTVAAAGARFTRTFGKLRVALDAALD